MNPDEPAPEKRDTRQDDRQTERVTSDLSGKQGTSSISQEPRTTEKQEAGSRVNGNLIVPPAFVQGASDKVVEDESAPGQSAKRPVIDDGSSVSENELALQILLAEALYTPPFDEDRESTGEEDQFSTALDSPKPPETPKKVHKDSAPFSERSDIEDSVPRVSFGAISFSGSVLKDQPRKEGDKQSLPSSVLRKRDHSDSSSLSAEYDTPGEAEETEVASNQKSGEVELQKAVAEPSQVRPVSELSNVYEKENEPTTSGSTQHAVKNGANILEQERPAKSLKGSKDFESSQRGDRLTWDILPEAGQEDPSYAPGRRRSLRTPSILEQRRLLGSPGVARDANEAEIEEQGPSAGPKGSVPESRSSSWIGAGVREYVTRKPSIFWETITEPDVSVSGAQPPQEIENSVAEPLEGASRQNSSSFGNILSDMAQIEISPRRSLRLKAESSSNKIHETSKRQPLKPVKVCLESELPSTSKAATSSSVDVTMITADGATNGSQKDQPRTSATVVPTAGTSESASPVSADAQTHVISGEKGSFLTRLLSSSSSFLNNIVVMAASKRFLMLIIFCACSAINSFQWIEYTIISNIVCEHYGVSEATVAWTSLLYLLGYMILAFPSAWVLDTLGLRVTLLLGAVGTCIGACIKVMSVESERFAVVLAGQCFPALAQAFILGVPPRLASVWFKYEEISTACSTAVIGNQLGVALGFLVPPYLVDEANVKGSLLIMCFGVAVVSCICLFLVIVAFQDKPDNPPSISEMRNRYPKRRVSFLRGLRRLLSVTDFLFLLFSYGVITGAFYAISTLLNLVVLSYFPGEESFAGWLGTMLVVSGLVGSWMCGILLDKSGKFKRVTVVVYFLSTVGIFAYTFVFALRSHALVVFACLFLGFFMTGFIPVGLQLGSEITYPLPEGLTSNMLNMSAQGAGFLLILVSEYIQDKMGDRAVNLMMGFLMILGCVLTGVLKAHPKRQNASKRELEKRSSSRSSANKDRSDRFSKQK